MDKVVNRKDQKKVNINEKLNQPISYRYYSNILNKPFKTLDELILAENEVKAEQAKKEASILAMKNACNIVNDSIDAYEEGKVKCKEKIAEAYEEYKAKVTEAQKELDELQKDASEKLNNWLEKHPDKGFHYTYKSKNGQVHKNYTYYPGNDVFDKYDKFVRLLEALWF